MPHNPIIHGDGKSVLASPPSGQTGGFERLSPQFRSSPAQPFSEQEAVFRARHLMANGYGMKQAALLLRILPSSKLDAMLWKFISVSTDDLAEFARSPMHPEPMF